MTARTTLLGVSYVGVPMFRSLALSLLHLEQAGKADKARELLDAHNRIRRAFGEPDYDLASEFTPYPDSMATMCPSALAVLEIEPARHVMTERARLGRAA